MNIATNRFVSVSYDLSVGEGDERELMERATPEQPLQFVYGLGMMIPAFEDHLKGLAVDNEFQFTLTPEEAYGEYQEENVVELPKNIFEVEGKFDDEFITEGATVPMMDSNGQRINGSVLEVKENAVVMDFNHPLAGETLHFSGKVLEVHEATAEEIAAITGAGGCGCGCGDDCEGDCDCGEEGHAHEGDSCGCGGCH